MLFAVKKNQRLTASETATLAKLSRIAGLSWSMMSIIGLSSSCVGGDKVSQSKIKIGDTSRQDLLSVLTSDCLMVTKRLRISRRMAMASLRVLSWQEQSSTSASPSTACRTVECGPRSAGILRAELACSS